MAYQYIVNAAGGGKVGKPGPPIQANVNGAIVLIYEVTETDVSPGDEFTLECVPPMGIVSLYGAEITDNAGGIVVHLQPSIGTAPGFVPNTLDHVWTLCVPTTLPVREANVASYVSPGLRLVVRSGVFAPGGSILHRFVITEGHGHPVGLGDGYSRVNPVPVEQLAKTRFFGAVFTNSEGSSGLAIDARFTGIPIEVHNGTDNEYWTGDAGTAGGSVDFSDSTRAFDGSLSVLVTNMGVGDFFEFDNGAAVDVSGYSALELRVWIVGNWTAGDLVDIYGVVNGVEVGVRVDLGSVIERSLTGEWQSAVIPTSSFAFPGTITGLRIEQVAKVGAAPTFSLDAIKWQQSGGPVIFFAAAPPGFRIRIHRFMVTFTAVYATAVTNNGSWGVSPLGFLTVPTLDSGILAALVVGGQIFVTGLFRDLQDLNANGYVVGPPLTDGTTTSQTFSIDWTVPIAVEGPPELNNLQFHLMDDFSSWSSGVAVWHGSIEPI